MDDVAVGSNPSAPAFKDFICVFHESPRNTLFDPAKKEVRDSCPSSPALCDHKSYTGNRVTHMLFLDGESKICKDNMSQSSHFTTHSPWIGVTYLEVCDEPTHVLSANWEK